MNKTLPNPLKKGDTIGIFAPSGPIKNKEEIHESISAIKSMGYNVIAGESCFLQYGYLSGTDDIRMRDINSMFRDKSVHAMLALRGGYGSQRYASKLDYEMIRKNPKIFMGYSDVTVLLNAISQKCGFVTFHSPMTTELKNIITEKSEENSLAFESFYRHITINFNGILKQRNPYDIFFLGDFYGELCGGNLSLIASSIGTPYDIETTDKVLFLEEIAEAPYAIDRMINHLKNAGKFDNIRGIILGEFTDCNNLNIRCRTDTRENLSLYEIISDLIPSGIPCIAQFHCGHCRGSLTLPIGADIAFDGANLTIYT